VKTGGEPKVVFALSPSNGTISRKLSSDTPDFTDQQSVKDFFAQHLIVDGFILRREKILDFVRVQDADRYQKFVQLLGITKLDQLQRRLVDAERQASATTERAKINYQRKLAVFNDPSSGFEPANLDQVFAHISTSVEAFDLKKPLNWDDLESRLSLLKAKRPQANREKIDEITRALVSLETPLVIIDTTDVRAFNDLRVKLEEITAFSVDALRSKIINEGSTYLAAHSDETHCPLCETEFEQPLSALLVRLKERSDALQELHNATTKRTAALDRLKRYASNVSEQIKNDLKHSELFDTASKSCLRNAQAAALRLSRLLSRANQEDFRKDLTVPEGLVTVTETRAALVIAFKMQKTALTPPDSTKLEAAIALLERAVVSWNDIEIAKQTFAESQEISRRTTVAKVCFSTSREQAIQQVFAHISGTVLEYYKRLHDFEDSDEISECTALELKPTSRSATGGLRLAIQFLGLANDKDPRAYFSEGHLDSLGLCLFLAAVRIFNPPGSLLVLDDVLTSIDKEHRRRVGELLFSEFNDFQIILTTHDDHWNELLQSSARAMGLQSQWQYIQINGWTVDSGPVLSVTDNSWDFIKENLTEDKYRNLGGPFRVVLEDFLVRTAAKIELKVRFNADGKYTAGDFVFAGITDKLRELLIKADPSKEKAINIDIARVLGQGDLINFLSHNNPGRLEVTFDQARDFVTGLENLLANCGEHKLIKGK